MPHKKKKPMDYRAFANKHFRDPTHHLPMISGTGHNTSKYVSPSSKPKKKEKTYTVEFVCGCGNIDSYEGEIEVTIKRVLNKNIPACYRCTNLMKVRGIKENIFIVLYIYIRCLLQILKRK